MAPRAWLVDASIYIFKAWFSLPDRWHTPAGQPLNAVVGYSGFLFGLLEQLSPRAVLGVAFDESLGTGFRHRIDPGYKASRALPDEALAFQLHSCRALTEALGVPSFGGPEYEADDYLATLARLAREAGYTVTLVSRDKDLGQLLGPEDLLHDYPGGEPLSAQDFSERFGVSPEQFADYQALAGDRSDDIPGVPGIGPRTVARLLHHFPDIDALLANLDQLTELPLRGAAGLQARLTQHAHQIQRTRRLTQLDTAVAGLQNLPQWQVSEQGCEAACTLLQEWGAGARLVARCRRLARE